MDTQRKRIYSIWKNMNYRCRDTSRKYYHGKGIKVCLLWRNSFAAFFKWAVGNGYEQHLTIDRINSSKGYSPSNCRWATYKTQAWNKSDTRTFMLNGKEYTGGQLEMKFGLPAEIVRQRVNLGWTVEKAVNTPFSHRKKIQFRGKIMSLVAWAQELGVKRETLKHRLQAGWSVKKAFTTPVGAR